MGNSLEEFAEQAQKAVDQGVEVATDISRSTATATKKAVSAVQDALSSSLEQGQQVADTLQTYSKQAEDVAMTYAKAAAKRAAEYPYAVYGGIAAAGILSIPFARRMLWRTTLGRLRSPESVLQSAQTRLHTVKSKVEEYAKEAEKLQARMLHAEEEMKRGMQKLKATRYELQRLNSQVYSTEKVASGIISDLSSMKHLSNSLQLRSDAANQLAALRSNRNNLQKYVYRIAKKEL